LEDEKRVWLRSEEEENTLNDSGLIYKDKGLELYLNQVAKKLQPPKVFKHIPFKITVIKNPYLNAFTFPNGVIYVHTGMLSRMENEAQLVTLLAHEMTHATHRHAVRAFRSMKNKTAVLATFRSTIGSLPAVGALANLLGTIGTLGAVTGYSRELETEADMEGFQRVIEAGYDPRETTKLFTHLREEVEAEKIREPFFFGTHPKLKERIKNYNVYLKTLPPQQSQGIKNSKIFMAKTRKLLLDNARLDLKAGRFPAAQQGVEKYLSLKPRDAQPHYLLGEIFRQIDEEDALEKAKAYYKKAISLNPSYPDPYKGIGLVHYKQGKKKLAQKSLKSYLSLAPKALDRRYILEYLKQLR